MHLADHLGVPAGHVEQGAPAQQHRRIAGCLQRGEPEILEDPQDLAPCGDGRVQGGGRPGSPVPNDLPAPLDPGDVGLVRGGGAGADQVCGQGSGQGPVLADPGVGLRVRRVGPVVPCGPAASGGALPVAQGQPVVDERVEMSSDGVDVLAERGGDVLGADRAGLGLQELQHPGPRRRQPRQCLVVSDRTRPTIFHRDSVVFIEHTSQPLGAPHDRARDHPAPGPHAHRMHLR